MNDLTEFHLFPEKKKCMQDAIKLWNVYTALNLRMDLSFKSNNISSCKICLLELNRQWDCVNSG